MRRPRLLLCCGALLLLATVATAATFTVSTEGEWKNGTFNGVTVRDGRLGLEAPLDDVGFETELALSYWKIYRGDAFVPETGFTGNDAIAFNGSDPVPGAGNVTQLNFTIPDVYVFESGSTFSAWAKHNASDGSDYRITYRLAGAGTVAAWVDERQDEAVCATDQAQQMINDSVATDSWYRFVFTLYPGSNTVHCEIHDDAGEVIDGVNLSGTIDYSRVEIRGEGDREPWAWFDDVTIPRYRAEGNYTSQRIDNTYIQDWNHIQIDAANITSNMTVNAVFWAQDSTGTVIERQIFTLTNGVQQYPLTVPNSQDAQVMINGSTTDPSTSWSIGSYTIRSNRTNISAPSISNPQVTPTEAEPGTEHEFTAELTDDDGDQNTVRLLRRQENESTWDELNRTTLTPTTAETEVRFTHTFAAVNTTNYVYFNTTDINAISDTTDITTFNTTYTPSEPEDDGTGGDNETAPFAGGNTTDGNTSTTAGTTNRTAADDTDDTSANTSDGTDTDGDETGEQEQDVSDGKQDTGGDTGAKWIRFMIILVVALAAVGGYFLYVHTQ